MTGELIVTTANSVEGRAVSAYLGVVRGLVVRSPGFGRSLAGAFSAIGGGNVRQFEEVCEEARAQAFKRMLSHAQESGAHAIIAMRYDATEFSQGITEVLAYGTAVTLAPAGTGP